MAGDSVGGRPGEVRFTPTPNPRHNASAAAAAVPCAGKLAICGTEYCRLVDRTNCEDSVADGVAVGDLRRRAALPRLLEWVAAGTSGELNVQAAPRRVAPRPQRRLSAGNIPCRDPAAHRRPEPHRRRPPTSPADQHPLALTAPHPTRNIPVATNSTAASEDRYSTTSSAPTREPTPCSNGRRSTSDREVVARQPCRSRGTRALGPPRRHLRHSRPCCDTGGGLRRPGARSMPRARRRIR